MNMDWRDFAACKGLTRVMFDEDHYAEAKAVCARCPVVEECRAVSTEERHGVWGARTPGQREWGRRKRKAAEPLIVTVTCLQCGRQFSVRRTAGNQRGFCSELCRRRKNRVYQAKYNGKRRGGQEQNKRLRHGAISTYHAGCRCGACKKVANAIRQDLRLARREREMA